jgi:hypothetical protein
MKLCMLVVIAVLLLCGSAYAEEPNTEAGNQAQPTAGAIPQQLELKIRLYKVPDEIAVSSGFEASEPDPADRDYSVRFNIVDPNSVAARADQFADPRIALLMETDLATLASYPGSVSGLEDMPAGAKQPSPAQSSNMSQPIQADKMGYLFSFLPAVDETGAITLKWDSQVQAPDANEGKVLVLAQQTSTTLRVKPGTKISAANLIPKDAWRALANAGYGRSNGKDLAIGHFSDGYTIYLVVTPTLIADR